MREERGKGKKGERKCLWLSRAGGEEGIATVSKNDCPGHGWGKEEGKGNKEKGDRSIERFEVIKKAGGGKVGEGRSLFGPSNLIGVERKDRKEGEERRSPRRSEWEKKEKGVHQRSCRWRTYTHEKKKEKKWGG